VVTAAQAPAALASDKPRFVEMMVCSEKPYSQNARYFECSGPYDFDIGYPVKYKGKVKLAHCKEGDQSFQRELVSDGGHWALPIGKSGSSSNILETTLSGLWSIPGTQGQMVEDAARKACALGLRFEPK